MGLLALLLSTRTSQKPKYHFLDRLLEPLPIDLSLPPMPFLRFSSFSAACWAITQMRGGGGCVSKLQIMGIAKILE